MSAEGLIHIKDSTKIWQHHADGGQIKGWFSDTPPPRSMWYSRETAMRGNHKMIDRFRFLLRALADSSERIRESKKPLYIPEDVVAYTVSNLEIAQRGLARAPDQATVAEQLLETSRKVIRKMVEQLSLELDGQFGAGFNRAGLRVGLFARFLPDWYRTSALNTCLLVRDPLSIVIECAAIAPDLLHPIIIMAYYAEVARVLIAVTIMARRITQLWRSTPTDVTVLFPERNREDSDGEGGPPGRPKVAPDPALKRFSNFMPTAIALFRNATPYNDVDVVLKSVPDRVIAKLLYMYTLPFVRRAAIVYYSIHGSYPVTRPEDIVTEGCEYDRLASLLNLPDPRVTLVDSNTLEMPMVIRWLGQWAASGRVVMKLEAAGPYELLSLPKYFDEMVIHYQKSLCYECSTIPLHPGICLFCGKIVCIAGDCCMDGEDNGEANQHMKQ
jgi:E3 ubiquitin-protein ligase UBR1